MAKYTQAISMATSMNISILYYSYLTQNFGIINNFIKNNILFLNYLILYKGMFKIICI